MTVQLAFCFIQVVGGFVNVAQITDVYQVGASGITRVCVIRADTQCIQTGDKKPSDFLDRIKHVCGGKNGDGR